MTRTMYWGLVILIIGLIGVSVVVLTRPTATEPKVIYKDVEPSITDPPAAEAGYKWVWHHDHWDKVPTGVPSEPMEPHPMPVAENGQASTSPDQSKDEGKPLDEAFYRDNFSRKELESNLKSIQRSDEQMRTVHIPELEEIRNRYLEYLRDMPDSEPFKKGLARTEAQLNWYKGVVERTERQIAMMSNVLNQEGNNVEK